MESMSLRKKTSEIIAVFLRRAAIFIPNSAQKNSLLDNCSQLGYGFSNGKPNEYNTKIMPNIIPK